MTITLTREGAKKLLVNFTKFIKWPVTIVIGFFLVSPGFWEFWRTSHPDWEVIVSYIAELKWPVVIMAIFLMTRRYIPDILDRLEEITAWKMKLKLKPKNQPVETEQIEKIPNSAEAAEDSSDTEDTSDAMHQYLTSPEVEKDFEAIWNNIFGSQLMIMKRLAGHVPDGLSEEQMQDLYKSHRQSSSNPYPSFKHLVQFLHDTIMVLYDEDDSRYKLTNAGLYFLRYIQRTGRYHLMPID